MPRKEELQAELKDELIALAEEYELDTTGTKSDLAERIVAFETGAPPKDEESDEAEESGVSDEPVAEVKSEPVPEDEPEPVDQGGTKLVRFIGNNPLWQSGRYTFTRDNPFQAVPAEVAERLVQNHEKFRIATDSEVQDFYS